MFEAWCQASGDPDIYVGQWLRRGAPAGLVGLTQVKGDQIKHRVILDCKASRVSESSVTSERVVLPRALDAVTDTMQLLSRGLCGLQTLMLSSMMTLLLSGLPRP